MENEKFKCLTFFRAIDDFRRLLITFANSLNPDQHQQKVHPGLIQTI